MVAYDSLTDSWKAFGKMPVAHVTIPLVRWNGRFVLPGGEVRPGVRSPEVWTFELEL
jgi:N-acetylneuraminate epimerase